MKLQRVLFQLALLSQGCIVAIILAYVPPAHHTKLPRLLAESRSSSIILHTATSSFQAESLQFEHRAQLLDEALGFNATAASELLNEYSGASDMKQGEEFLDALLSLSDHQEGAQEKSKLPWWTRFRPLARISRRARRAALGRVLDLSTPSPEETGSSSMEDDADAARRRRGRSLLILLRALADSKTSKGEQTKHKRIPAILQLECAARREAKSLAKAEDMANRLPAGLETPNYSVLNSRSSDGYEVRRYEPFSVCSVAMEKPRPDDSSRTDATVSNPQLAGASAFGALAGYLFGKNQESTSMKMTTPVLTRTEGNDREMSFVLPSEFWNDNALATAPRPLDGSGVTLQKQEGEDRAVVMFGGFASKKDVEQRTKQLLDALARDKEWKQDSDATVTLAQYNDPFTPPWKRRNEVSVKVVQSET